MNEKTLTMEELKGIVSESVKETIGNELSSVKTELEALKAVKTDAKAARAEKSAEFIKSIIEGKEVKTITTNTNSFGYSVPTELADAIHEKKDKIAKIRKYAFVFAMDGKFQLPTEGTGVTAYWVTTEADSDISESNPTVDKTDLDDYYLAARVRVPYKLINTSAFDIENFVSKLSARELVRKEETAFVAGSGSSQPTGIRSASITDIALEGSALAYDDIVNLFYGVPEQYRSNGTFLASTMAIKALRKIKDTTNNPIFNPQEQTLFGRPLAECTDIPENLGTAGNETEIYFGDLQEYWIKDGQSMQAEVRPVQGRLQVDLFMYQSVDGVLVNTDAFRKLVGVK